MIELNERMSQLSRDWIENLALEVTLPKLARAVQKGMLIAILTISASTSRDPTARCRFPSTEITDWIAMFPCVILTIACHGCTDKKSGKGTCG